jgi:hypothetical protein
MALRGFEDAGFAPLEYQRDSVTRGRFPFDFLDRVISISAAAAWSRAIQARRKANVQLRDRPRAHSRSKFRKGARGFVVRRGSRFSV